MKIVFYLKRTNERMFVLVRAKSSHYAIRFCVRVRLCPLLKLRYITYFA